jgi:hypothetical protein
MHCTSSHLQHKNPKTYYDAFLSGAAGVQRHHLSSGCIHYLDEPVKKYHWQKMDCQFLSRDVRNDGILMPADPQTNEQQPTREMAQAVTCDVVIRRKIGKIIPDCKLTQLDLISLKNKVYKFWKMQCWAGGCIIEES